MNLSFTVFDRAFIFNATMGRRRSEKVHGYSNRTTDGMYIVTLDYDGLTPEWIRGELVRLQQWFALGTFYLFSSGNGYHAVCFDKLTLAQFMEVLHSSSVDPDYFRVPLTWHKRCWILRVTPKTTGNIQLIDTIVADSHKESSHAHIRLLENLSLIPKEAHPNVDSAGEITLVTYYT